MIRKITESKHRKGGFTLVELLVTCAILSLVTLLSLQLSYTFYRRYAQIEQRWIVQNAAKRVMQYFEMKNDSLTSSANVALFYTSPENRGTVDYGDDDVSNMKGVPTTGNNTYAYIYTMPASNPELGDVIWVLDRGEGKTPVNLTEYILQEEIPLSISFEVSTVPIGYDGSETVDNPDGSTTVPFTYGGGEDEYLTNTINVTISTPHSIGGNYELKASYTMNNMMQNQQVNFENGEVCKTTGNNISVAGWTRSDINKKNEDGYNYIPCPIDPMPVEAKEKANILRYTASDSFVSSQNLETEEFKVDGACFGVLAMEGSSVGTQVKGALRDFRDNVLRKTELGNTIIDKYYNEWSPALLAIAEEHPAVLTLGKIVLVPASVLAFFAAE